MIQSTDQIKLCKLKICNISFDNQGHGLIFDVYNMLLTSE